MKHINYFLSILFIVGISFNIQAQSEEEAIKKTLNDYLDGGTNGDVQRFMNAFVPEAIQRSVGKSGAIAGMTVKDLASKIQPGQKMTRTTRIVSWSYAGTAATGVTETEYETSKIIDLLNLLKINGEWKIVSRVFSRIEKNEQVSASSGGSFAASIPAATTSTTKGSAATPAKKAPAKKPASDDGWE